MRISDDALHAARGDTSDHWAVTNDVLYHLCRSRPGHTHGPDVTAKVLLIGRSCAAALERRRSAAGGAGVSNERFYTSEVPRVLGESKLDERLAVIRCHRSISQGCVEEVLDTHAYLMGLFRVPTGKSKRSLASKYLHFHAPELFFIYDSRAAEGLRLLGEGGGSAHRSYAHAGDAAYRRFVLSALDLRDSIKAQRGYLLTPRQLDRLLLGAFEERRSNPAVAAGRREAARRVAATRP